MLKYTNTLSAEEYCELRAAVQWQPIVKDQAQSGLDHSDYGRELQFPVWLDLEWNNQRALESESIHKLAETFEKIITAAGYQFGIYCNVDWYTNVICSHLKKYDFWIA